MEFMRKQGKIFKIGIDRGFWMCYTMYDKDFLEIKKGKRRNNNGNLSNP